MTGLQQAWKRGYFVVSFDGWKFFVWSQVFVVFVLMVLAKRMLQSNFWGEIEVMFLYLCMMLLPGAYFMAGIVFVRPSDAAQIAQTEERSFQCLKTFLIPSIYTFFIIIISAFRFL